MKQTLSRKIHIIDDDPHTITILEHVLGKKNYEVKSSLSGAAALELFKKETPDLILLDILMPEMDGYQVCHLLKQDAALADVPVIFITASHDTSELVKGFDAGAVDFISKPVNKSELLARVNTHLELKQARDIIEMNNRSLSQEIENRKQAEEKFRALSETTFEAVVFLQDGIIIEANKAATVLFGLEAGAMQGIFSFTDEKGSALLRKILQTKESTGPWEINFFDQRKNPFFGLVQYQSLNYKGESVNVLAIRDITRQKEIDKEIFNAILDAEEKERKRFSRDMHDGLGALLSTLKIYVGLLQKENKSPAEKEMLLSEIKDTINKAVESARTIANNLMPSVLMDHGLVKALKAFADALNKTGIVKIYFSFSQEKIPVNSNTQIHLYRIILELINNTLKHAHASQIHLSLGIYSQKLKLEYSDNGKGFDFKTVYATKTGGQGLKNIISRLNFMNGEGEFHSSPGGGLRFYLAVPL